MADSPAAPDRPGGPDPAARRALATRVWGTVCRHIDGMAIGSTMAALASHGALQTLAAADRTEFGKLRAGLGAQAGFLHVAIRLLADQGWVTCAGEGGTDELSITPTPGGRVVMTRLADGYAQAARFLSLAGRVGADPAAAAALEPFLEAARRDWGLPVTGVPAGVRHQVLAHLNGHLVAPVMFAMTRENRLPGGPAAEVLARPGWVRADGGAVRLTAAGEMAVTMAPQYRYPMVYLPLLRSVPGLIFGGPSSSAADAADEEAHLDRSLDIRFSGEVFAATCRAPFLDVALPLFDRQPLADQPALVVDMGCGDGTLLAALYAAVCARTARGRRLGKYPLLMVGADPSPVARRAAAARLAAAGVPHHVMDGDIADPSRLARELAAAGHDAHAALHVCKSAIHDRAYRSPHPPASPPGPAGPAPGPAGPAPGPAGSPPGPASPQPSPAGPPPVTLTAFAHPDGSAIPAAHLALNLAELFRSWQPLARRHGWIVIEAHSVRPATAAALIGRTLATALDATHGYSCQYPVEPEVFAWAARAGGFISRAHHEPGASALGHTQLTIDHFEVDAGNRGPE